MDQGELEGALRTALAEAFPESDGFVGLERLVGGASKETWSLDVLEGDGRRPLVLRRAPQGEGFTIGGLSLAGEAAVIEAVGAAGLPVPRVHFTTGEDSPLGPAFAMDRVTGVGDPVAIARDSVLATARQELAFQVGAVAAQMQAIDLASLPELAEHITVERLYELYDERSQQSPVVELGLRWLGDNAPPPIAPVLCHGDYRNSNLIVGAEGLAGVIDWEFAHAGDPLEDLALLCMAPWRFGRLDRTAGGFGTKAELFAGYSSVTGEPVDGARFHHCQVLHTVRWCIGTMSELRVYRDGDDPSLERGLVGRRLAETELDLLDLLEGIDPGGGA
ncbi:MAG: phosphotransferase family protein [Myxococcales bacterium]|nr:phosphotransferase family protein [Myxococcales bacterium]